MEESTPTELGKLHVIFGPMFSGKTSELLRRIKRYQLSSYKCLVIKHSADRESCEKLSLSDSGLYFAEVQYLDQLDRLIDDIEIIGIDEGQFFPNILGFCKKQIEEGKIVIVASLDSTTQRTGFSSVLQLVPLAHTVEKLSAVCMSCGDKASFSKKTSCKADNSASTEKYMAVCRQCYKIPQPEQSSPFKRLEMEPRRLNFSDVPLKRMRCSLEIS
ncbi:THymidine Kinase [Nesidiocoris tenuis]|uniref:Thymidine kinase n=1 Tax=Nesidiocoris tenuis TaxID=355587 RepID=A0ABN7B8T8_9HEMI|nr:THymidine Kinase [Nesidiocoris tenuis]